MTVLRGAYSEWLSEGAWNAKLAAFRAALSSFEREVVTAAVSRAVVEYPDRMPTLGQMLQLCDAERTKLTRARAEAMRGTLLLPEPPKSNQAALQAFYSACDDCLAKMRGPVSEDHRYKLEGLVWLLAAIFGIQRPSRSELDEKHRHDFAAWVVGHWQRKERHRDVEQVLNGLRRAPRFCVQFPTVGILDDLVSGFTPDGYGDEWVAPKGDAHDRREASHDRRNAA
jgi:hypothetical protein